MREYFALNWNNRLYTMSLAQFFGVLLNVLLFNCARPDFRAPENLILSIKLSTNQRKRHPWLLFRKSLTQNAGHKSVKSPKLF